MYIRHYTHLYSGTKQKKKPQLWSNNASLAWGVLHAYLCPFV